METTGNAMTGNAQVDAQNDITALITEAKKDALTQVNAAASAIDKLMSQAAGDAPILLSEEEKNAVPLILEKVPAFLRGTIASVIDSVLSGNAYQGVFTKQVMMSLAYAQAEVKNLQTHMTQAIKTL